MLTDETTQPVSRSAISADESELQHELVDGTFWLLPTNELRTSLPDAKHVHDDGRKFWRRRYDTCHEWFPDGSRSRILLIDIVEFNISKTTPLST